jgi:DNA-binding NarL/FixJ family response regulator
VGKLRILIADDHPLMVLSERAVLAEMEEAEVVGEATTGRKVLPAVEATRPDLVLLDVHFPDIDGLACLDRIRERYPEVGVVVVSASDDDGIVEHARATGARGFIAKSVGPVEFADAIRHFAASRPFRVFGGERAKKQKGDLTDRELSVVHAVARGLSNKEIARELWIAEQTVKFHLGNIFRKLAVANRTEAARVVYERGLGGSAERAQTVAGTRSAASSLR